MSSTTTYTDHKRQRKTRWSVYLADRAAQWLIAAGGIGTILAVLTVCVFLVWVVVPLFAPGSVVPRSQAAWTQAPPLHVAVDDRQILGRALLSDGRLALFRADTGEVLETREFLAVRSLTAAAFSIDGQDAAFGFADGSVRLGRLTFTTTFVAPSDLPESLRSLQVGQLARNAKDLVLRTAGNQFRVTSLVEKLDDKPLVEGDGRSAIHRLDYTTSPRGPMACVMTIDGKLSLHVIQKRESTFSDNANLDVRKVDLPLDISADRGLPQFLLLSGLGDNVYLAWSDGHMIRYNTRDLDHPRVAEKRSIVKPGETLTALSFMLGRATLAAGASNGTIRGWFCMKPQGAETPDGALLVAAHVLPGPGVAVTSLALSARTRMLAAGYADGRLRVYCMTNERLIVETGVPERASDIPSRGRSAGGPESALHSADCIALSPRDDGLLRCSDHRLTRWQLDAPHPEVSLAALFLPVWYEGYERPEWVWQSSSGSDESEPKLGLVPLVFGTLKATLYSMLFGVPLALCAALYTSEFLASRAKAKIKPAIEMMASLPSVVLGFLAGLVIAPFVEGLVPSILTSFFTVPLSFLSAAYVWQLLPPEWTLRWARWRFVVIVAMLPLGVLMAVALGPTVERLLFAGNIRAWLDGHIGTGTGGWVLLLVPLCAVGIGWFLTQRLNPWLRRATMKWSRTARAMGDLIKFFAGVAATVAAAWLLASLLTWLGFDPRGSLMSTYVQRNALVVGFVMGFAIIPIIYTIADDALSSVPEHLRSASLGAGATPWQTATRIIIPTAMSGLFSAVMIGLGRAVGETMIVLMAAGNTPIMDWNIFSGFQTLSAMIATELPEAVRNSSHYRTLFLAALTLFLLTFLVNTVAELIRLRFRRRAYEL